MKTIGRTSRLLILLVALLITLFCRAQRTYLIITKSNEANDYVMYPPGTKFELKNEHGYIIFKNSGESGSIVIKGKYRLYVYPNWKDRPDVYELTQGKVEKLSTKRYSEITEDGVIIIDNTNEKITADYKVADSKAIEGKKNLEFKLSNGITFSHKDGTYNAYLNDQDNYLNIEGKYVIESELGVLKLSFNPTNGAVWWIFEPVEE